MLTVRQDEMAFNLELINTQSSLRIRRPTNDELGTLERVEITLQTAWDPFDDHYNRKATGRYNTCIS